MRCRCGTGCGAAPSARGGGVQCQRVARLRSGRQCLFLLSPVIAVIACPKSSGACPARLRHCAPSSPGARSDQAMIRARLSRCAARPSLRRAWWRTLLDECHRCGAFGCESKCSKPRKTDQQARREAAACGNYARRAPSPSQGLPPSRRNANTFLTRLPPVKNRKISNIVGVLANLQPHGIVRHRRLGQHLRCVMRVVSAKRAARAAELDAREGKSASTSKDFRTERLEVGARVSFRLGCAAIAGAFSISAMTGHSSARTAPRLLPKAGESR